MAVSKQQSEYLIDAHNIRITAREGETLLSVTNEKGPKELTLKNSAGNNTVISGTIIGHCVLGSYLVLFVHDTTGDSILRIDMSKDEPEVLNLFNGGSSKSLGFDENYPIEAISDYENENIQKVYWIDGLNQPRVINIVHAPYTWAGAFDFVPELQLNETVEVTRVVGSSGQFPAGTIQYAFSYYNKYGQESNIFYTTPLYYTSYGDRGGTPEKAVANAFNIVVNGIDSHFEYLRIYSIQRTSIDAVPTCKRLHDAALDSIQGSTVKYTDTGTNGDIIDPTSLLYIGGEEIVANSIGSKDGTLFLGNIEIKRPSITAIRGFTSNMGQSVSKGKVSTSHKNVALTKVGGSSFYTYYNGLNIQAAGFKNREYYRLGIQAQYKNGKWSEPVWIGDYQANAGTNYPSLSGFSLSKIVLNYAMDSERRAELKDAGYKKIRPVVVFPDVQDRTVLCQGVANPTLYTSDNRSNGSLYAQSSWFFRPHVYGVNSIGNYTTTSYGAYSTTVCSPYSVNNSTLPYTSNSLTWDPKYIRGVEIQGQYDDAEKFKVDWSFLTLHSPDIDFDDSLHHLDFTNVKSRQVGIANVTNTASDMSLQTSTPAISNSGTGFIHKASTSSKGSGIISGLFYDDYAVDDYDSGNKFRAYDRQHSSFKWMTYLWQKNGSINNDINRSAESGARSANLSKKVVSNLRFSNTIWQTPSDKALASTAIPQVFESNEVTIVKVGSDIYEGNIDTLLAPNQSEGLYFAFGTAATTTSSGETNTTRKDVNTPYTSVSWWKTWSEQDDTADGQGLYKRVYSSNTWKFVRQDKNIGDGRPALAVNKEPVRLKYKSTPHIALKLSSAISSTSTTTYTHTLPILELYRAYDVNTAFGGTSQDALKANLWVPAGDPIPVSSTASLVFEYGDTWYSRYDCLKTYPFTTEDTNQVVEIGSFMLETRVNIDGRYDRNRGQVNNLNMSPVNFNLFNPIYSQKDNFFNYRILDNDYYRLNKFPNQITWSTEKVAGQDVDNWTSITLASTYDMDGSKGEIRALSVWNDSIYCFQDSGICNILFNSRVQIPVSDGVPIEISNSYKVDGKRYISDGVGCVNKFAICYSPMALYFIDSVGGHLQAINGNGLADLSLQKNMVTWLSQQSTSLWKPSDYTVRLFYDKNNSDVYINTKEESLCYSEALGEFVSFMSYPEVPIMFNVVDRFYCLKSNYLNEMFAGDYNYFFGQYQGYDITFVANGKTQQQDLSAIDKIFTNIEFRADRWSDKLDSILSSESPFDYVRVWNEYQDTGEVLLNNKGHLPSNLKKKFRIWRIQIPRDAYNRRARMRNTWCKIKLGAAPRYHNGNDGFVQLHDISTIYYI
jgi:hypothetical protein